MPFPRTPIDTGDVVAAYLAGESALSIATRVRVDPKRLRDTLRDAGVYVERSSWRTLPMERIVERYTAGESEKALADAHGCQRGAIRRVLQHAGVEIRGVADANRLMMTVRTPEDHRRNTMAAHAAVRGRRAAIDELERRALTKQKLGLHDSVDEGVLHRCLQQAGYEPLVQAAVGPYNIDLAVHPVAVEVFGGKWHSYGRHVERWPNRRDYLFDRGWNLVIVWVADRYPLQSGGVEKVISYLELARGNPSLRRQQWMVRGNGDPHTAPGFEMHDRS